MLWFVMMILGGAGPPPQILTDGMRAVGDATPVRHVTLLLQDAWLGFGWDWTRTLIVAGFLAGAAVVTMLVSLGRLGGEG
jgi:ABC-2 type transport system permease protein